MDKTPPAYNFPYKLKPGKKRAIFSNYGLSAMFNVEMGDAETSMTGQRVEKGSTAYHAVHPTVPLFDFAMQVPCPWSDRVMGETNRKNQMAVSFVDHVSQLISQLKRSCKKDDVATIMEALKSHSDDPDHLENFIPSWFDDLLKQSTSLHDTRELQRQNSRYAGGCLTCLHTPDTAVLAAPSGVNFDTISLHQVSERSEGLLRSDVVATECVNGEIYGISGCEVQSQNMIAVRTGDECLLYTLDSPDRQLSLRRVKSVKLDTQSPLSINPSPYIPGEAVLTTDQGNCFLWTDQSPGSPVFSCSPRFEVSDGWSRAQFGAHPREIIHADLTAVQLFDLRSPSVQGLDLFALPSKFLHTEERIRACHGTLGQPFHQFVATDYSLVLVDQRFPGHPVLQWDHMLTAPPQYMVVLEQLSHTSSDDSAVFLASQSPADVHAFRFTRRGDNPCQMSSLPWRVAKIRDICEWPQFTESLISTRPLRERLDASLVGLDVAPGQDGFTVFQVDSHGDIFHQVYQEGATDKDVTFSAGAETQTPHPDVVVVVQQWAGLLEKQAAKSIVVAEQFVLKDVSHVLEEIRNHGPLHISCPLCLPSTRLKNSAADDICSKCMHSLEDGRNIVTADDKNGVITASASHCIPALSMDEPSALPSTSALSRLLLKLWSRDPDIDDILKDRDKEVVEYKQRKKNKMALMPGMDEASVLARLTGEGQSAESPGSREGTNPELTSMDEDGEPVLNREPGGNRKPETGTDSDRSQEPELNRKQAKETEPVLSAEDGSRVSDSEAGTHLSDEPGTSAGEESADKGGVAKDVSGMDSDLDLVRHTDLSMCVLFEPPTTRPEVSTTPSRRKSNTEMSDANVDSDASERDNEQRFTTNRIKPVLLQSVTGFENVQTTPNRHKRNPPATPNSSCDNDVSAADDMPQISGLADFNMFHIVNSPSNIITTSGRHKRKRKHSPETMVMANLNDSPLPLSRENVQRHDTRLLDSGSECHTPLDKRKVRSRHIPSTSSVTSETSLRSEVSKHSLQLLSGFLCSPKLKKKP